MAKILFVCLGNICRSPTAEAVLRARAQAAGLTDIFIDSAGTGNWHIGQAPDPRAIQAGQNRAYDLKSLRARQVSPDDFSQFTHILAMDNENLNGLRDIAPAKTTAKICLFLDYAKTQTGEVPDPYFGGRDGFEHVLDLIEAACDGLIAELQRAKS